MARLVRQSLEEVGYTVDVEADGRSGYERAAFEFYDLLIVDYLLPSMSGGEICRALRDGGHTVAIVMLTARRALSNIVEGLDAGADEYVTKPFDMEELLARLRAALRRGDASPPSAPFRIGRHEIDLGAHSIVADGAAAPEPLHLTPTEWRLLEILLSAPGQLVSSDRLLSDVWGPGYERSTHYRRFHMAGLRRKLEDDPHRPRHLLTEPGMGYRFQPDPDGEI